MVGIDKVLYLLTWKTYVEALGYWIICPKAKFKNIFDLDNAMVEI